MSSRLVRSARGCLHCLVLLEGSAEAMCRFVEVARGRGDAQTLVYGNYELDPPS